MMTSRKLTPDEVDVGSWRLLRWLEHYPFQRAQDMLVALLPWEHRSTLYHRLADLQQRHLIESLRLGVSASALYLLSPRGAAACTIWAGTRQERSALRHTREHLLRLLPRLPVLLVIQELVNGLVLGATRALTRQGRQASVLQWNWQRDYAHHFRASGPGEQTMIVRTDGALALRLRFGSQTPLPSDEWYSLVVLYCPLDDLRVLRHRLDRLLRWRESAERRATNDQMPTVLILATTARQAEWWHLAAAQVARKQRKEALCGAVATLPESGIGNGWRLGWRRLETIAPCHVQDVLEPTPHPALPELAHVALGPPTSRRSPQSKQVWQVPSLPGERHSYRLCAPSSAGRRKPGDYRLRSLHLAPRHWEIVLLCFAHPLLSVQDLVAFEPLSPKSVQRVLHTLERLGYLTSTATAVGQRWQLAEDGLRLLASASQCTLQRFLHLPAATAAPLQQRGVKGLLHQMQHTAGVYGFFTTLATELERTPDARLRWWETGARCERVFAWNEQIYHFKPDAFAGVHIEGRLLLRFWLEYDRGTMFVRDLESKCATYAAFLSSREWALGSATPPLLLAVVPDVAQEQRLSRTAQALLAHIVGLRLYTTTLGLMVTAGLLAPIWQPCLPPRAPPEQARRVALFGAEGEVAR